MAGSAYEEARNWITEIASSGKSNYGVPNCAVDDPIAFIRGIASKIMTTTVDQRVVVAFRVTSEELIFILRDLIEHAGLSTPTICDDKSMLGWEGTTALDILGKLCLDSAAQRVIYQAHNLNVPFFRFRRTIADAVPPVKNRLSDSGYDLTLHTCVKTINTCSDGEKLPAGSTLIFDTGISVQPPPGYYFDLVPCSRLGKRGWCLSNSVGIIDSSYRGSIMVALTKLSDFADDIQPGDQVVQLIPRQHHHLRMEEVTDLDNTTRGNAGGLGSGQFM